MARAKRHFIPGYIWHITHRCHKREFLLKFSKDRHRYMQWLYQARKRYGFAILNYMITSNHIHLLVVDTGKRDVIPRSMKLVAGRTGQEYNQRKNRRGAYWEDRYHATAVESGEHLARCLIYSTRIWYAPVWSATRQSGLSAAITKSRNPEGKTY
jgi:putative transposase